MKFLSRLFGFQKNARKRNPQRRPQAAVEGLEERVVLTASPLPVLMVIADQQDFYYQEYGQTRQAIEAEGVSVQVAATSMATSYSHPGTGEPEGSNGAVVPDLTLADVDPDNYSAIVFVGGWGSSMYQYAFDGDYLNNHYDGDLATKQIVNDLINEFVADDKYITGICHGTTVLAWARVDGVSPLNGKVVSVPYIGSPAVNYNGYDYGNYELGQYEQAVANGAIANTSPGQYGVAGTASDDVVVDGRVITAENYDSALEFGRIVAEQVIAAAEENAVPENQAPTVSDATLMLDENSPVGTNVGFVSASDPDLGQTLSYAIVGGNINNAFAIDPATGQITVANSAAVNFEAIPEFQLTVQVTDNAETPLNSTAVVTVQVQNLIEAPVPGVFRFADDLVIQGTDSGDTIYVWSGSRTGEVYVWMNSLFYGAQNVEPGGRVLVYSGDGNDQVYATDMRMAVSIFGEGGHDLIAGGAANDLLDGGDGVDRICGSTGDDLIRGGDGDDFLYGQQGNDIILGGNGNDYLDGDIGADVMIGGWGRDYMKAGAGDDLIIGGLTDFDNDDQALAEVRRVWTSPGSLAARRDELELGIGLGIYHSSPSVHDDGVADIICGGNGLDLVFANLADELYLNPDDQLVPV